MRWCLSGSTCLHALLCFVELAVQVSDVRGIDVKIRTRDCLTFRFAQGPRPGADGADALGIDVVRNQADEIRAVVIERTKSRRSKLHTTGP